MGCGVFIVGRVCSRVVRGIFGGVEGALGRFATGRFVLSVFILKFFFLFRRKMRGRCSCWFCRVRWFGWRRRIEIFWSRWRTLWSSINCRWGCFFLEGGGGFFEDVELS